MASAQEWDEGGRERRLSPFASFRYRNYRWLWAANVCLRLGEAAMLFLLGILVIDVLGGGNSFLALIMFLFGAAALVLVLPAGVWADRRDRRAILIASHVAVALGILLTAFLGPAQSLLGLATMLLVAIGLAIGAPVRKALIPALVPANRLLNGNALDAMGQGLAVAAGPVLAVLASDRLGVVETLLVVAAVLIVGTFFLIPLRIPARDPLPCSQEGGTDPQPRQGMWDAIGESYEFIASGTPVLSSLFALLLVTALAGPWLTLNLVDLADNLDVNLRTAAWLYLLIGGASLVSLLVIASIPRLRNAGTWYAAMVAAGAVLVIAIWFASSYGLAVPLVVLYGLAAGISGVVFLTLVQSATPTRLMGRVMAMQSFILALGAVVGGIAVAIDREAVQSDAWGVAAGVVIAVAAVAIVARNPRLRRMPSHPETPVAPPAESGSG